jgi:hypothetical protein
MQASFLFYLVQFPSDRRYLSTIGPPSKNRPKSMPGSPRSNSYWPRYEEPTPSLCPNSPDADGPDDVDTEPSSRYPFPNGTRRACEALVPHSHLRHHSPRHADSPGVSRPRGDHQCGPKRCASGAPRPAIKGGEEEEGSNEVEE